MAGEGLELVGERWEVARVGCKSSIKYIYPKSAGN